MSWSPQQYLQFEDERTRPARDLLAQVPLSELRQGFDLGCGPGNSTELLVERFGAAGICGLDSDAAMLASATERLPGLRFIKDDLATWRPERPVDLLFANAVFQWLPDHLDILDGLMDHLAPGGVLAVQMPDNLNEPTHLLMEETAYHGPWRPAFLARPARRNPLPPPSTYYQRLAPKARRIDLWHTIYNHPLAGAGAVVEWVKSTGLRPYLERAGPEHRDAFLASYRERIAKAYPEMDDGKVLLRFPRLFMVAVKRG